MNVVFHLDVLKIRHTYRREAQTVTYYHLVIIVVNLPLAIAVNLYMPNAHYAAGIIDAYAQISMMQVEDRKIHSGVPRKLVGLRH